MSNFSSNENVQVTRAEIEEELIRCQQHFSVVRLLSTDDIVHDSFCLLSGEDCPCMRQVCLEVVKNGGHEVRSLKIGGDEQVASARYVEVDGKPHVLLCAQSASQAGNLLTEEMLYHDALTGAFNRRYYEDKVCMQYLDAGVALLDLDDFKLFNDTFGHQVGDAALKAAAKVMQQFITEEDMLIRYGGDEFLLVFPGIAPEDLKPRLLAISKALSETTLPGHSQLHLSASIGALMSTGRALSDAMRLADKLMYRAKQRDIHLVTEDDKDDEVKETKPTVLIVDDSEMNRAILREILGDEYEIIEAATGEEGIAVFEDQTKDIAVLLLDLIMPGMSGFDVLSRMQKSGWIEDTPVVMISSEDSDNMVVRAFDLGASDYISRPFDVRVVKRRVSNIMRLYAKQRHLSRLLVQQFYEREKNSYMLVDILSGVMELRNGESGLHVLHIRKLTEMLIERLVQKSDRYIISVNERSMIAMAAALHDVGKMAIEDDVLNKPGKLTPEEYEIMKNHTIYGAEMLMRLEDYADDPLVKTACAICRWHHERWDGNGYPDGLKGDEIPISAQVVSLADVYDALTSERVYKKAVPHDEAMRMILNGECGQFNPLLISCLVDVQDRIQALLDNGQITPPLFQ